MKKMSNVLKIERDSMNDFQKEMYLPKNKTESVGTRFSMDLDKRSFSSHAKEKLTPILSDKGEISYTASKKYDSLLNVTAFINLFSIRVKDKYKDKISICYHHNLGHNILYSGECKIDKEHFGYIDSKTLDIHSQFFVKKREIYNEMVGNIPCFQDWGSFLPKKTLIVPQPYSFSRNSRVSLTLLKSLNDVTFEYKTRLELCDLIKMRAVVTPAVWDDGNLVEEAVYKEIKFNYHYLETNGNKSIPIPELWGRYSEMTEAERNWRKSIDENTGQPRKQIIYIEDFESFESTNPVSIGSRVEIPIGTSSPAKHVFWMASLVDTGYSNYTTSKENLYRGWNPCSKSGIKYGTSYRVSERSHEHFDISEAYDFNFPNTPNETGYNVHTYTFNPMEIQSADTSVVLKECGATLTVLLEDTNPFLTEDDEDDYDENGEIILKELIENDSKKDKYFVHVRTMVTRKMEIFWDDKTGKLKYNIISN